MGYRTLSVFILFFLSAVSSQAQKPFSEGIISYKIKLESADHKQYNGEYIFTFKGAHIKKELKLDNGFNDIVIIDCGTNTVYSLQNRDGKKYAIQLSMDDMLKIQQPFQGFALKNEEKNGGSIAGYAVCKGKVNYKDGTGSDIYYSKEWYPAQPLTFERFPDAKFIPMRYAYTDENGIAMEFEIARIEVGPIENALFRIPADYKMISHEEYLQLSR